MKDKWEINNSNLRGEGLASVPCTAEDNIAIVVNAVTRGNDTEHITVGSS
jgi:hypothetical protein